MLELSDYSNTGQVQIYDIEAISLPIVCNKFGDHDLNGLLYALKLRPLVIRANVGNTVQMNFECCTLIIVQVDK